MANHENVQDDAVRAQLAVAHQHLRKRQATEAVHACVTAFLSLLETKPDAARTATVPARGGRSMPLVARWPNLGANLSPASLQEGNPKIEFTREKFAMSEAITYYEFTVDAAIALEA